MQEAKQPTPWHVIENQITGLRVFESQIEDLRRQLAEDWQARLSRREDVAVKYRGPSDAIHFDYASNPAFSAC